MLYFWSDPHFYHKPVIEFCERPFNNLEHMHTVLIHNYNSVVKKTDTCVWVGDCFFSNPKEAKLIMKRLNGRKILVRGNHDKMGGHITYSNIGFDIVVDSMDMVICNRKVHIKHYPFLPSRWSLNIPFWKKLLPRVKYKLKYADRRPIDKGQYLIHGHTHQKETIRGRQIHVGVDSNNYTPISLKQIEGHIQKGPK
jgi:calcineurin-like phosphoesterase family protein